MFIYRMFEECDFAYSVYFLDEYVYKFLLILCSTTVSRINNAILRLHILLTSGIELTGTLIIFELLLCL